MADYDYDMLVIGSGPAGQRAAIQAAKLDKRVAIVERNETVGGAAVNVGTIPSKTLREAVLYLSGYRERGLYGVTPTWLKGMCGLRTCLYGPITSLVTKSTLR
jgi:NAD(P) transhydrogenase